MSEPRSPTVIWMGCAFGAALGLASAVLLALGSEERGTDVALQATARLSFLLFWPAYAGGALTKLFGSPFDFLRPRARDFGLAFASAHIVHLALVGWLVYIGAPPGKGTFVFFGSAALWTYLLVLFSIGRLQRILGPIGWRLFRVAGLNYIAYAFAVDFLRIAPVGTLKYVLGYVPFVVLAIIGPTLCLAAFTRSMLSNMLHKAP